jgi:hypothetical protein
MKQGLKLLVFGLAMSGGVAMAQEFTTRPRRPIPPEVAQPRSPIEQNSNSDIVTKFRRAHNKLQLVNPFAPAEYGSGEQVLVAEAREPQPRPKFWRLIGFSF